MKGAGLSRWGGRLLLWGLCWLHSWLALALWCAVVLAPCSPLHPHALQPCTLQPHSSTPCSLVACVVLLRRDMSAVATWLWRRDHQLVTSLLDALAPIGA